MNWHWVVFQKGPKFGPSHCVPADLRDIVVNNMISRDCPPSTEPPFEEKLITEMWIDQPGMCCTAAPNEEFILDGLKITIPCEDVATFVEQMRDLPVREHEITGWYKIHGFMCCLCLWSHQEAALYGMLLARVPEAERRAAEFYATRMTPNQALHVAQGLPADERLGPDRLKRFVPKTGAKA